jgi:hypothetical protein
MKNCKRGHEMTSENTGIRGRCKSCVKIRDQVFRSNNPSYYSTKYKEWKSANPGRIKEYDYKQNRTVLGRFSGLKSAAKSRGHVVTLSLDEYKSLIEKPCFYCGGILPETGSGLDRRDSGRGYELVNVLPCCTMCNRCKSDLCAEDFRAWILQVSEHWATLRCTQVGCIHRCFLPLRSPPTC